MKSFLSSLFSITDEQAMWRVQTQDDHAAFAQLVERWEEPIQRLCARMLGDLHRAEDLTQEAFARVFARRKDYNPGMRFGTWLWRIALNLCYDDLRRLNRRGEPRGFFESEQAISLVEEREDGDPGPDQQTAAREEIELVQKALMQLPEATRSALVLRFCEGMKLQEIADIQEITESTVRYRLAEGLTQMASLLGAEFKIGRLTKPAPFR